MNDIATCSACGCPLPADAPAGLCPKCLLAAGLESGALSDAHLSATAPSPATSTTRFVPPSLESLAEKLPQYEFLELLGQGGMGAVYKARQRGLDRLVAIKILPAEIGHDAAFAERFAREARALAKLSHPNIVAVYDFGNTQTSGSSGQNVNGLFYIVMEFVDGANLRQTLRAGGMTPEQALAVVPQICDALQFAHDESVVHRDIKPENILIDKRGRVKIADFGLAKMIGGEHLDAALTGTHQVMGTLRYMAPEQLEGTHDVDHRADIYSLGVVFYELLTGELPLGRFAAPSKKVQIDVRLDEVVLRALEKEPSHRYQHASDIRTGIEAVCRAPEIHQPSIAAAVSNQSEEIRSQTNFQTAPTYTRCVIVPALVLVGLWIAASFWATATYGQPGDGYRPIELMRIQLFGGFAVTWCLPWLLLMRWMKTLPDDIRSQLRKRLLLLATVFVLGFGGGLAYFISPWNQPHVESHGVTFRPQSGEFEKLSLGVNFVSHMRTAGPYYDDDRCEIHVQAHDAGNVLQWGKYLEFPGFVEVIGNNREPIGRMRFLSWFRSPQSLKPGAQAELDELFKFLDSYRDHSPGDWDSFVTLAKAYLRHYEFGEDLGTRNYIRGNPSPGFFIAFGGLAALWLLGTVWSVRAAVRRVAPPITAAAQTTAKSPRALRQSSAPIWFGVALLAVGIIAGSIFWMPEINTSTGEATFAVAVPDKFTVRREGSVSYLSGHRTVVVDVAISGDGKWLAAADEAGYMTIRATDGTPDNPEARLAGSFVWDDPNSKPIHRLVTAQDGKRFFVAGNLKSPSILILPFDGEGQLQIFAPTMGTIAKLFSFDNDTKITYTGMGNGLTTYDLKERKQLKSTSQYPNQMFNWTQTMAVAPDRKHIAFTSCNAVNNGSAAPYKLLLCDGDGNEEFAWEFPDLKAWSSAQVHFTSNDEVIVYMSDGALRRWVLTDDAWREGKAKTASATTGWILTSTIGSDGKTIYLATASVRQKTAADGSKYDEPIAPYHVVALSTASGETHWDQELKINSKGSTKNFTAAPVNRLEIVPGTNKIVAALWDGNLAIIAPPK